MRICDICKSNNVNYNLHATIDDEGHMKKLELCTNCYLELKKREKQHLYFAYIETIKARNGEIPHKSHWWDKLILRLEESK